MALSECHWGHTPGLTGFRIESGTEQLLVWGDMAAVAAVQFSNPNIGVVFDVDTAQAAKTRIATFDMVAADRLLCAGSHLPFPAYGHVVKASGEAYRWAPEEWQYGI